MPCLWVLHTLGWLPLLHCILLLLGGCQVSRLGVEMEFFLGHLLGLKKEVILGKEII